MALLNSFQDEFRLTMAEHDLNQTKVAQMSGYKRQYIPIIINSNVVTDSFVKLYDALGYDIKIEYIKKK